MKNKLILIIDDDPEILEYTQVILEDNGFDVETALSSEDGLKMYSEIKPDLVLCDMMMEKLDSGVKMANEIRMKNSDIPIYLMSSVGEITALNTDIYKLGFNGILQKPIDSDLLLSSVKGI